MLDRVDRQLEVVGPDLDQVINVKILKSLYDYGNSSEGQPACLNWMSDQFRDSGRERLKLQKQKWQADSWPYLLIGCSSVDSRFSTWISFRKVNYE